MVDHILSGAQDTARLAAAIRRGTMISCSEGLPAVPRQSGHPLQVMQT
jgi:hypothetical protein